jgi:hypothetical protein
MTKKTPAKKSKPVVTAPKSAVRKPGAPGQPILGLGWGLLLFLGISTLLFLIVRFKLLAVPLERDEGSFAYIGHWLMNGRQLYTDMLDSKLPGLYVYYATFMSLFGYNATGVHVGLLVANLASGVFLFLFLKEVFNKFIAVVATTIFLWMVVSPSVVGFAAHATQLLTPFVLAGFFLFWKGLTKEKQLYFFLAGLAIGIAFTIKQQSAIFGILIATLWWPARLLWHKHSDTKVPFLEWLFLGVGGFLPAAMVLMYFQSVGRMDEFINWTYTQPINLAGAYKQPWYEMLGNVLPLVLNGFYGVWIAAVIGLVFIFISGHKRFATVFGVSVALLGLLSIIIGVAYYKHYFVLAIPGIAILAACTLYWISQKIGSVGQPVALGITAFLIILSFRGQSHYYFATDYYKIHFDQYAQNMFPEMETLGKQLGQRVKEGERIAIMGSEPEILVAADRESCSKHLMVYSMLIDPVISPPMQQEYIQELFACNPEYVVWATGTGSWAPGYDQLGFFETLMQWLETNYVAVGLAESRNEKPGVIVWDEAMDTHLTQNDYKVFVLKKRAIPVPPPVN